jgi:hypothetical protein
MRLLTILSATLLGVSAWANTGDEFNIRVNAVGVIVGAVGLDFDIKVADNWTLGPQFQYWHLSLSSPNDYTSSFKVTDWSAAVRANWFHNGAYTRGLYVGPSAGYASSNISVSDSSATRTASGSGAFVGCLVGYGWFWDNFNMMLGGGAKVNFSKRTASVTNSDGSQHDVNLGLTGLDLEYTLGWTF